MKKKDENGVGDFEDAFSSVPHTRGLRCDHHLIDNRSILGGRQDKPRKHCTTEKRDFFQMCQTIRLN